MASTDLEKLPNELQIIILKYLSLVDRYLSFFRLNSRYDVLLSYIIPSECDKRYLETAISDFSKHSHRRIKPEWKSTKIFYLIPNLAHRTPFGWLENDALQLQWKFISERNFQRYIQQHDTDSRLLEISSKHPIQLNSLFFRSYDFHWKIDDMLNFPLFLAWLQENHSEKCDMLQKYCERMMQQSYYYNAYNDPHHQTFIKMQRLEVKDQAPKIYQQAQNIWTELKNLGDFNYSELNR